MEREALRRATALVSLLYVSLPLAIWMVGWLRPLWVFVGTAALLCGTRLLAARWFGRPPSGPASTPSGQPGATRAITWPEVALVVAAVTAVVGLNGAGGFGVQTSDWAKHNAVLDDLIRKRWPVVYVTSAGPLALVYYVAYYLPAAVAGKLWGWAAANAVLFAWTVLGAVLGVLWVVVLTRARVWVCLAGFLLYSGLEIPGALLWSPRHGPGGPPTSVPWLHDFDLEWWTGHWSFQGTITLLAYVPGQAIGGWLLTGMALDGFERDRAAHPYALLVSIAVLWSPYVALGLAGLCAILLAPELADRARLARGQLSVASVCGLLVGGLVSVYLAARFAPFALPEADVSPAAALRANALAFQPSRVALADFASAYAVSVLFDFLALALATVLVLPKASAGRRVLAASTGVLLLLPFFQHGRYNDLVMRASIPALLALAVLALRAFDPGSTARRGAAVVGVLLVLGALHPANMLRIRAGQVWERGTAFALPAPSSLFEQHRGVREHWPFLYQYVGAADTVFFRSVARQ
jgi:hypothetical protein